MVATPADFHGTPPGRASGRRGWPSTPASCSANSGVAQTEIEALLADGVVF